ncbi:MAG: tRNA pseudouridine(55) synthase TruB [Caldilineaceae bacterium]|nr:tRNA pseudouridine(55) synthase TruB [Caldilineaceae bacterium]
MNADLHGILLVDKPGRPGTSVSADDARSSALPTSHDIVQHVRRWSRQRRIGHTGTLDPMASGLLVLCLGVATRLVEYYQGHEKRYEARVTLGRATDTFDAVGQTVAFCPIPSLTAADVEEALAGFLGQIVQQPPVYSALKQGGESLHRKARRGEAVEVAPRPVTVHEISLLAFDPPDGISLRVRCSAGTYVRSLAVALGEALGTVAHLSYLRRLGAGPFSVADASALPAIEEAAVTGRLADLLVAPDAGLGMPCLTVNEEEQVRLGHGQKIFQDCASTASLAAAYDSCGRFLGIARALATEASNDGTLWKAEKWLAQQLRRFQ